VRASVDDNASLDQSRANWLSECCWGKLLRGGSRLVVATSDEILVESIALRFQVLADVGKAYWQRAMAVHRAIAIPTAIAMLPPTNRILAAADSQHAAALDPLVGREERS
jgi:hypothetical protein